MKRNEIESDDPIQKRREANARRRRVRINTFLTLGTISLLLAFCTVTFFAGRVYERTLKSKNEAATSATLKEAFPLTIKRTLAAQDSKTSIPIQNPRIINDKPSHFVDAHQWNVFEVIAYLNKQGMKLHEPFEHPNGGHYVMPIGYDSAPDFDTVMSLPYKGSFFIYKKLSAQSARDSAESAKLTFYWGRFLFVAFDDSVIPQIRKALE